MLRKGPGTLEHGADIGELRLWQIDDLDRLAVLAVEARLGVERVHLARPAVHVQEDDAARLLPIVAGQNYQQAASGTLAIDLGGTAPGSQYDQFTVAGSATLNGELALSLVNGFVPTIGTQFDVLNASSVGGTFATVTGTSINASEHFEVTYNGNEVLLTVVAGAASPAAGGMPLRTAKTLRG